MSWNPTKWPFIIDLGKMDYQQHLSSLNTKKLFLSCSRAIKKQLLTQHYTAYSWYWFGLFSYASSNNQMFNTLILFEQCFSTILFYITMTAFAFNQCCFLGLSLRMRIRIHTCSVNSSNTRHEIFSYSSIIIWNTELRLILHNIQNWRIGLVAIHCMAC